MAKNKIYIPYFISNESFAPAKVFPRIFFYNGTKECDIIKVQYYDTGSTLVTTDTFTAFPYFDHYSGQTTTTSSLSLLFLNEEPVYGTQPPSQSLFDKYWSNYINLLYDPKTRILRCNAVLPFAVYSKLELNDIIQLRSNYYHLRAINDYNLRTGECRMELLGPLLEGSLDNKFTFDNTCEQAPTLYGSVLFNTSSQVVTFGITGSNCCNNPNYVTIKVDYATGSCPATPTNTIYETVPNSYPINIDMFQILAGSPGPNCVTMSVANLCYGLGVTGSYTLVFTGSVSGSYGNTAISGSAQKNNCPTCQTGSFYTTTVAANTFSSSISQSIAQASASAYLTSVTQSNANIFGSCSINYYYNDAINVWIQKNDCSAGLTGSIANVIVPVSSSIFTSTCSLAEANDSASAVTQSRANLIGTCYSTGTRAVVSYINTGTNFGTDQSMDLTNTSNLPLSISVLTTQSLAYPDYNDAKWVKVMTVTQSQRIPPSAGTGSYLQKSDIFNPTGSIFLKIEDKNGNRIRTDYQLPQIAYGREYTQQAAFATLASLQTASAATFINRATASHNTNIGYGFLLNDKMSSSYVPADSIVNKVYPLFDGALAGAPINYIITASVLWSTSSIYPSSSDPNWTTMGYSVSGSAYQYCWIRSASLYGTASTVSTNGNHGTFSTGSGYYYYKMESGSTLIPIVELGVSSSGIPIPNQNIFCTVTGSASGGILQVQISQSGINGYQYMQSSTTVIYLSASSTYFN
jgi:hypothetical protein